MTRICLLALAFGLASCQNSALRLRSGSTTLQRAPALAPSQQQGEAAGLRLLTFNAGLAVGVLDHSAERAPRVAEALSRQDVDVLCVQEFWLEKHWQMLLQALGERLPERLHPGRERAASAGPCQPRELEPVRACVSEHCSSAGPAELAACAVRHCRQLAPALSRPCLGCLSKNPLRAAAEILDECAASEDSAQGSARSEHETRTQSYAYGGAYGIGLLTRMRMLERDTLPLRSAQHPRAVLYARVARPAAPDLHLFCTHLTPAQGSVPYPGTGSWQLEQAEQVDALLGFVERKAGKHGHVAVLGDLNTGPGVPPSLNPRLPAHYARFVSRGFVNPYLAGAGPRCTFCSDNRVGGGRGSGGSLLDHVLLRNVPDRARARRILDEPIILTTGGQPVESAYSDHYGVLLELF
jgi:endonuclease/exonuclease/phosphatase family metal-dependent hydrolase